MGTGLQRHIGGCGPRARTGLCQRECFRVGPSAGLRPAAAQDVPITADNDATDGGIGRCRPKRALRQTQRMAHVTQVVRFNLSQS